MRINSQLKVISYVTAVAFIIMIPVLVDAFLDFDQAKNDHELAESINQKQLKSNSLRNQYILYYNPYVLEQLDTQETENKDLLQQAISQIIDEEDQQLLQQIPKYSEKIRRIFGRVIKNHEFMVINNIDQRSVYAELETRLISQLLLKISAIGDIHQSLLNNTHIRIQEEYEKLVIVATLFAILLATTIIVVMTKLGRMISRKLACLHEGAKIVADGDLNYRIPDVGNDEFAELAQSINSVTANLQSFTQKLESEIHEREHAENRLQLAHDQLERRVESRTQELANKVNDLEQAEQTLEEREQHLHAALNNMSSAILITDRNGIIRVINQNYRDYYSLAASDVELGQSINIAFRTRAERGDFGSGDTDDLVMQHLPISREGKPQSFNERLPDGRVLELFCSATDDGGHVTIVNDITDRKRTENELIQSGKLATLGRMSAGISHELSQPLNIIRLSADGALMDIEEGLFDSDGQQGILETVVQQTVRMAETIDHMRVFSRRDQKDALPFDPAASIEDAVQLFSKQFEAKNIELVSDLRTNEWLVKGAASRLEQVLLNFLSNAADSIAECAKARNLDIADYPGKIEITVGKSDYLNTVIISVRDNGNGVPDHVLAKIFDPFYTTKEVGAGTGLGLSISHAIIETMGGKISVNRLENGACFVIELPCSAGLNVAQPTQLVPQPEDQNADGSPSLRLLLVDDEELARNSLARFFERLGHKVETAGTGLEALEIYKPDTFDVVIADLQMPGMSGEKMIQEMRKITRDITVIVTTGKLHADGTHPYSDDPTIKVFTKPISVGSIAKYLVSLHDDTQNPA